MSEFLFHYYAVDPRTWVYLSSLLTIGLFFKFGRFWSVRNLDLALLILLSPGLLLVHFGGEVAKEEMERARMGWEASEATDEELRGDESASHGGEESEPPGPQVAPPPPKTPEEPDESVEAPDVGAQ